MGLKESFIEHFSWKKAVMYGLYVACFGALIIYARKYWPVLLDGLKGLSGHALFIVVMFQIFILVVLVLRLEMLLRPLNERKVGFGRLFCVYNAANVFKYLPKGVNYYIRVQFFNYITGLKGRWTSSFAEGIIELYVGCVCALILSLFFLPVGWWMAVIIFLFVAGTWFLFNLWIVAKVLDFLGFRFVKVRKGLRYLMDLILTKEFWGALSMSFVTAGLHAVCFKVLLLEMGYDLGLFYLLFGFYASQLLGHLTGAPGGLGVRDASLTGLFVLGGVTGPVAVGVALTHRALVFLVELIFGLPCLWEVRGCWK